MAGFRPTGNNGSCTDQYFQPGDTMLDNGAPVIYTANAAGTLAASALIAGFVYRAGTGGGAGFSDALDSAQNIITALASGANNGIPMVAPGSGFTVRVINGTAFTQTITAGTGITINAAGAGATVTLATQTFRDLLFVVNAIQQSLLINSITGSGSASVTFALATGQSSLPIGPSQQADNITPGAVVTGTGMAAGTTVIGVTQGQGGIIGVTLSGTATATGTTGLTFGSSITAYNAGSGTW